MNGKQLKNSILQWAIQGKLVPQDPNDEPASVLLERIRAEKARLVKEGKIKKDKNESIIYKGDDNSYYEKFPDGKVVCIDEEIPFEIPKGWEWARLNVSVSMNPRNTAADDLDAGFIPMTYIDPDLSNTFKFDIRKWKTIKSGFTHLADGDVAFAKITPCITNLKAAVMRGLPNGIAAGTTELNVFRCYKGTIIAEYILYYLATPYILVNAVYKGTAGQQRIMTQYLASRLLPIPPYKEQQRIVDKIKALLPVIQKYNHAQDAVNTLNEEIYSLLQKSILQEAIQGKLVPQDPSEESSGKLLERINSEKQQLVKEGKLKAKESVPSIIFKGDDNKYYEKTGKGVVDITEEIPFEIPSNWCWTRASSIAQIIMGQSPDGESINSSNGIEFHQGKVHFTDKYLAVAPYFTSAPSKYAEPLSLLLCVRAPVGVANITERRICIGRGLCALNFYKGINLDLMFYFFATFKKYYEDLATGSTFKAISKDIVSDTLIPIPPEQEQIRIIEMIQSLYSKIA